MGFSRQEYWSGCRMGGWRMSFSRGSFPTQICSPCLLHPLHYQVGSLPPAPPGTPWYGSTQFGFYPYAHLFLNKFLTTLVFLCFFTHITLIFLTLVRILVSVSLYLGYENKTTLYIGCCFRDCTTACTIFLSPKTVWPPKLFHIQSFLFLLYVFLHINYHLPM